MIGTAALLLASVSFAKAQGTPQPETTSSGSIDVGGRFTTTDGDEARYERYRDLRDGVNANFSYSKETSGWTFDAFAKNIGYRDGHYELAFSTSRIKFTGYFDQTPLNYAYYTRTPWNCTEGSCTLDAGLRTRVQNGQAVGVPQNVGQLQTGSAYNSIAQPFDLQSRRDTIAGQLRVSATDNLDFVFGVRSYKRTGNQPWGASFAFSVANELPVVIDNRETELSAAAEWASHQGMFHVGYQHSKFDQNVPSLTWDNPQRATDFCRFGNAANPPGVCYDPSGYSNGNGPASGRLALPPSNTVDTIDWMGMVKLPGRTTANASLSVAMNHQDDALIPWTSNSWAGTAPAVYAAFPELAALPRDSAQIRVNYTTGTFNVSSRAIKNLTLSARYRHNSRSDFAHPFNAVEYVRFDAVPEETGGIREPYAFDRNTLDLTAAFTGLPYGTLRAGYVYDQYEHGVRPTLGWKDDIAKVSYDLVGTQWLTLRGEYNHAKRRAFDFSEEILAEMGMQPAARFYDEASRDRDRFTLMADVTPVSSFGLNFTLYHSKDDYAGADSELEFGLLDNTSTGWTVGANYAPNAKVNVGIDYGRESYKTLQESRNANPAPDPSWTDPNRNWSLNHDDKANFVTAWVDLVKAIENTDIRIGYNFSDSDQAFIYGGPRISALAAANQFIPLPNATNKWHQATIDVRYSFSKRAGLGLYYMYEKFDITDFGTLTTAGPVSLPRTDLGPPTDTARIDWLGSLTTGYGNFPYKGQTFIVRLFYLF
jgi:hypothetical protein